MRVFLSTADASGDLHAAGLVEALRARLAERGVLFPGKSKVVIHRMLARGSMTGSLDGVVWKPEEGEMRIPFSRSLKDITAAHQECPRCGYMQLEASHCSRCGVDLVAAIKQKRKEDLIIEKKIRELRRPKARAHISSGDELVKVEDDEIKSETRPPKKRLGWLKRG